jgi:hypothetical protein
MNPVNAARMTVLETRPVAYVNKFRGLSFWAAFSINVEMF